MKIVLTPIFDGNPYQRDLANALKRLGHIVDMYKPSSRFPLLKYIREKGKPDVFHLHWIHPFLIKQTLQGTLLRATLFIIELMIIRLRGIKIVWTVHNVLNHERVHPKIERTYIRIAVRFFNEITFLSKASIETFNKAIAPPQWIRKKYHVVPHGNYINSYKNRIDKSIARQILDIDEDAFVLMCFGQIRPYKGIHTMIEMMKELPDPNLRLVIAGKASDYHYENMIKELCKYDRRILPFISYIEDLYVQIFMNVPDVVVLSYSDILNSGAAVLAMSFGKPLIAPNVGSIPELVDSNGGILFDPFEKNDLLKAIEKSKNLDLETMGKYNLEKIKKYDWDYIAQETHKVYST